MKHVHLPFDYPYYVQTLVVRIFAFHFVRKDLCQFHYHVCNFDGSAPSGWVSWIWPRNECCLFIGKYQVICTCSEDGVLCCKGDDFKGRLRLLGELAGYLDVNKLAIISESFPSYSSHQHLKYKTIPVISLKSIQPIRIICQYKFNNIKSYRSTDITNESALFLDSLLNKHLTNSVDGFSFLSNKRIYVNASACVVTSNSGMISWN